MIPLPYVLSVVLYYIQYLTLNCNIQLHVPVHLAQIISTHLFNAFSIDLSTQHGKLYDDVRMAITSLILELKPCLPLDEII